MIIIADDLTGANDTAIQCRNKGYSSVSLVMLPTEETLSLFSNYQVVAFNTNSRSLAPREAYEKVNVSVNTILKVRKDTFYKKIDSLLRGNPGAELDAVMDASGINLAFVAPAYPKNGRLVKEGITTFSEISIDVVCLFKNQMAHAVGHINHEMLLFDVKRLAEEIMRLHEHGLEVFIFDSDCDADLDKIYQLSLLISEKKVYCGSAAFAYHIMPNTGGAALQEESSSAACSTKNLIGIICGTRNRRTREQMLWLTQNYQLPLCLFDSKRKILEDSYSEVFSDVLNEIRQGHDVFVVTVSGVFDMLELDEQEHENKGESAQKITLLLGDLAANIHARHQMKGFIVTGGDTAQQVCASLGAYGIVPQKEIEPGIPFCTIVGGIADGIKVITKSGSFGSDSALAQCIEYLKREA